MSLGEQFQPLGPMHTCCLPRRSHQPYDQTRCSPPTGTSNHHDQPGGSLQAKAVAAVSCRESSTKPGTVCHCAIRSYEIRRRCLPALSASGAGLSLPTELPNPGLATTDCSSPSQQHCCRPRTCSPPCASNPPSVACPPRRWGRRCETTQRERKREPICHPLRTRADFPKLSIDTRVRDMVADLRLGPPSRRYRLQKRAQRRLKSTDRSSCQSGGDVGIGSV